MFGLKRITQVATESRGGIRMQSSPPIVPGGGGGGLQTAGVRSSTGCEGADEE